MNNAKQSKRLSWKVGPNSSTTSSSKAFSFALPFSLKPPTWYPPEWDESWQAAQTNRASEVHHLVKKCGVPPDHANPLGQTALHIAALWGHVDCVAILVSRDVGANPNVTNRLSRATPLHMAIQGNKIPQATRLQLIVKVLLQGGANPLQVDATGKRPVDYIDESTPSAGILRQMLQPPIFQALESEDYFGRVLELFYKGSTSPQELACQLDAFHRTTVQVVVDLLVGGVEDPQAPVDPTMLADFDLLQILLSAGAPTVAAKVTLNTKQGFWTVFRLFWAIRGL